MTREPALEQEVRHVEHAVDLAVEQAGEVAERELLSLRRTFAERRIDIASMDRSLRWATLGAGLCLLATAALILLRDIPGSFVTLLPTSGVTTTLAVPQFVATIALLAVGLGYVTAGAVLAHRVAALFAMVAITAALGEVTGVLGYGVHLTLQGWATGMTRGLLAVLWLLAIAVTLARRRRHGDASEDRKLRLVLLFGCCALYGGYFVILAVASPAGAGLSVFPGIVSVLMTSVPIVVMPILTVAAVDFGEWGEITARRAHDLVHPRDAHPATRYLAPVACCGGLLALAWIAQHGGVAHRIVHLGEGAGLLTLLIAVLAGLGALVRCHRQAWPESLNFAGLFAAVAVNLWVVAVVAGWFAGALHVKPTPAVVDGRFTAAAAARSLPAAVDGSTVLVPDGWPGVATSDGHLYSDVDPVDGTLKMLLGRIGAGAPIQIVAAGLGQGPALGPATVDGALELLRLTPVPPLRTVAVWVYDTPQSTYFLVGEQAGGEAGDGGLQQLSAIARSFRPAGTPPAQLPHEADVTTSAQAEQASADRLQLAACVVALVTSALGLALLAGPGRRWPGRLRMTILIFGAVSLATLWYSFDSVGRVVAGRAAAWTPLSTAGLLAGLGLLGLIALAASTRARGAWTARLPGALVGLLGGVLALRGIELLYEWALSATQVAGWAVVIILVAVAWDFIMSGESMTNHASALVPRSSRVLLFLGYGIVLDAAAVFFAGQKLQGEGAAVTEVFFEPDAVTQAALFRFALPVLLVLFLLRSFAVPARVASAAAVPEPDVEQSAASVVSG